MKTLKNLLEGEQDIFDPEKKFKNRSIGIISASRGHLTDLENRYRSEDLRVNLESRGHHVIPAEGGYIENYGSPQAKDVRERAFIVMHPETGNDRGKVFDSLTKLGKKYDQDSVLYKPYNSDVANLHGTNETGYPGMDKREPVGTLKMKKSQFFTKLSDGRHFSFMKD